MKEVISIIRPEKLQATRAAVEDIGIQEIYSYRVLGRGRQGGLRYLRPSAQGKEGGIPYLPKQIVAWLTPDDRLIELITAVIGVNQTGNLGDGKILVCPLEGTPITDI